MHLQALLHLLTALIASANASPAPAPQVNPINGSPNPAALVNTQAKPATGHNSTTEAVTAVAPVADANNHWKMTTWSGTSCTGTAFFWSVPDGYSCTNLRESRQLNEWILGDFEDQMLT